MFAILVDRRVSAVVNDLIDCLLASSALNRFAHQVGDYSAFVYVRERGVERVVHVVGNDESGSGDCADFNVIFETLHNQTLATT